MGAAALLAPEREGGLEPRGVVAQAGLEARGRLLPAASGFAGLRQSHRGGPAPFTNL